MFYKYHRTMKRISFLLALVAVFCLSAACRKEEKKEVRPTAGVWVEHILPDGVERTLTFAEGANSATYMAYHFDPEIFREEMQVPFVIDKENGQVKLSFSGIDNRSGISEIVLEPLAGSDSWTGNITYSDNLGETDRLHFCYAGKELGSSMSPEVESIQFPSDRNSGPQSPEYELPKLAWDNPIEPMNNYSGTIANVVTETILSYVGKQILDAASKKLSSMLVDDIWKQLFPSDDPMAGNIIAIMQDISIIKQQLEIIEKQLREIKIELLRQNLQNRNSTYIALASSISNTMLNIEGAIAGNKDDHEAASAAIEKLILEWGKETVNGNPVYTAVHNYVGSSGEYPALYDDFARETLAWESDGYEWREMLRTTDEALVGAASALTVLYYAVRNRVEPTVITEETLDRQAKAQMELLGTMDASYRSAPVIRHPDQMICQIPGLHMVFSRNLEWRDLKNPFWYPTDPKMWISAEWLVFGFNRDVIYKERFTTEWEYNALMKYYSKEKTTLLGLLDKIGFAINPAGGDGVVDVNAKATMILLSIAVNIPGPGGPDSRAIFLNDAVLSRENKIKRDKWVGSVRTKQVLVETRKQFIGPDFKVYNTAFDGYTSWDEGLWFNLRVLKRD